MYQELNSLIVLADPRAILPTQAHSTDVGYDLTLIDVAKQIDQYTALYETGIIVKPPVGYYFEIVPRSSLSKSGYMLSNSVGIIDCTYTGSLKVALTRVTTYVCDSKINLNMILPSKCVQLILRKQYSTAFMVVESVNETERGQGGFGSSS